MFKQLVKAIVAGVTVTMLRRGRRLSLQMLEIESAKYYLEGLRIANLTVLGLLGLGTVVMVIGLGLIVFHAGVFMLLPWSVEVKGLIALFLGLLYMAMAGLAVRIALNQKTWMEKAGVSRMVQKAVLSKRMTEQKAA